MINGISPTTAADTGYFNTYIKEIHNDNRVSKEIGQEEIIKGLREDRKKVQQAYNAQGQLIEYDKHGRHLDLKN